MRRSIALAALMPAAAAFSGLTPPLYSQNVRMGAVNSALRGLSAQQEPSSRAPTEMRRPDLASDLGSLPVVGDFLRSAGLSSGSSDDIAVNAPKTAIPGPTPLPGGLGSSLDVLRIGGLHKAFQQYRADFGPVCKVQIGSNSTFILVADPDLTRQVTMTDFGTFRNRNAPGGGDGGTLEPSEERKEELARLKDEGNEQLSLADRGGVGVVAANDEKWKAMRATAISSFGNPKLLSEYARVVSEETAALIRRLQPYARVQYVSPEDQPNVDVYTWTRRLTTEVIARIAFSKRLGLVSGSGDDGGEDWKQLADSLQRFLGNAGRVGRYQPLANAAERTAAESGLPLPKIDVPGLSQLQADTAVMEQYEKLLIDQRRESQQLAVDAGAADEDALGGDLLGTLMRTHVAGSETPLSDADVQANVREAFVAGSETTAAAISLTLQLVSANPRIEWLVRKELKKVLGDKRMPSFEDLNELTYLKLCIRETMRLYPSAHVFGRTADADTEIGGFVIPKGSNILMSPYYLGRDRRQWGEDADVYRPERHLPSDPLTATRSKFAWMPFGAGPRMCLGASLAMTEATVCVAGIMQNFKLEPLSKRFRYDYLITIELEDGLPMRLRPLFDDMEPESRGPVAVVRPPAQARSRRTSVGDQP